MGGAMFALWYFLSLYMQQVLGLTPIRAGLAFLPMTLTLAVTATLAPKLAQREDVACFVAYAKRLPRGAGYAITIRPYPGILPDETPARLLNRALEELVRECPEQYLWGYNRYKTPRGAKPKPEAGENIPPAPPAA